MAIFPLGLIYYSDADRLKTSRENLLPDIKSAFHLALEHCHFMLLDVERLALSLLSHPRNEQVVIVFVCCHL